MPQDEAARSANPVIVIVGDSTVADYPAASTMRGWGQMLGEFLTDGVKVVNLAAGGRSSKSFIREGRWKAALAKKPDFVLIQFGHNDCPGKGDRATKARGDYMDYIRQYVRESRGIGATPVLITPMTRRRFAADGKTIRTILRPYADAMLTVAREEKVACVDLHARSVALYESLGDAGSAELGNEGRGRSHFSPKGARKMAELIIQDLPAAEPKLAPMVRKGNAKVPVTPRDTKGTHMRRIVVAVDGSGDFKTVQAAVDAVPEGAKDWTEILVKNGTYDGLVGLPAEKGKIILRGEDREETILQSSTFKPVVRPKDGKKYNKGDVTVTNAADDVILANLTVRNFTWKANPKASAAWDVAVLNMGDRFIVHNAIVLGRHNAFDSRAKSGSRFYVAGCLVEGQSHFLAIFDNDGMFENTTLRYANVTGSNYASGIFKRGGAQEKLEDRTKLVIKDCTLTVPEADRKTLTACANNWSGRAVVYYIGNTFEKGCRWKPFAGLTRPTVNGTAWIFRYGNKDLPPLGDKDLKNPDGGPMIQELTKKQAEAMTAEKLLAGDDGWNPKAVIEKHILAGK